MQPKELRIGNYISDLDGKIIKVEELTICAPYTTKKRINNLPFDYYKPIPLTEEILLKCGFEFNDSSHYQISKPSIFIEELRYVYNINDFEIILFKGIYYYKYNNNIEVKYLHQLQNLFFSLCGEELNPVEP